MSVEKPRISINAIVLMALALIVTAAAIGNAVSALLTDSVWILTGSHAFSRGGGFTPTQIFRSADPVTFYAALVLPPALAAYMVHDLWKRYRHHKQLRGD